MEINVPIKLGDCKPDSWPVMSTSGLWTRGPVDLTFETPQPKSVVFVYSPKPSKLQNLSPLLYMLCDLNSISMYAACDPELCHTDPNINRGHLLTMNFEDCMTNY